MTGVRGSVYVKSMGVFFYIKYIDTNPKILTALVTLGLDDQFLCFVGTKFLCWTVVM